MEESRIDHLRSSDPPLPTHRLAERIVECASRLVERTVEEMYRNPFWIERFGDRGRRFALTDGRHHVDYLADALRWRSGAIMAQYAAWLQSVLVNRGMCTLHVEEHFERLADAILEEFGDAAQDAITLLHHARRGLVYAQPPARTVQEAAPRLIDLVVRDLGGLHAEWRESRERIDRATAPDDPEYVVSYLADAVASGNPRLLSDYLAYLVEYSDRHRVPRSRLTDMLHSLARALAEAPALATAATMLATATDSMM